METRTDHSIIQSFVFPGFFAKLGGEVGMVSESGVHLASLYRPKVRVASAGYRIDAR